MGATDKQDPDKLYIATALAEQLQKLRSTDCSIIYGGHKETVRITKVQFDMDSLPYFEGFFLNQSVEELAPLDQSLTNKPKARGVDFKILEIIQNEPSKHWQPTFIIDRIRPLYPNKTRDQLLSTAYLALSRLHADEYLIKISRGIYILRKHED